MSGFFFDEASVQKIAEAVRKINGYDAEAYVPPESDYAPMVDNTRTILKGTFEDIWAKGDTATVTSTADNGDEFEIEAENYFADVGESGATKTCLVCLVSDEWILFAAECSD